MIGAQRGRRWRVAAGMLALALALLVPLQSAVAGSRSEATSTSYTREETPLGNGATAVYESIALDGTLLTDEIRAATDWEALAATGVENPSVTTLGGATIQATAFKTIGLRLTVFNSLGWVVIQYTIWQDFGYDGSRITYHPAPYYDHQANWGWSLKNHTETAWWVRNPTHRASRGWYYFKQEMWTPFGNIGLSERSGWVRVDYHGDGRWTSSGS